MKTKAFLDQIRDEEVVEAIRRAEQRTSGEIRVCVTRRRITDPVAAAERAFLRLGMHQTRERNGVLIFVAPRSQQFAVIGDTAVHARCGPAFWTQVAEGVAELFRKGDYTGGITHAVHQAGVVLGEHFPRRRDDQDELSNAVERD